MKTRDLALMITCLLALPGVSMAQEHAQHEMHHGQMQQGMMMQMPQMQHGMMGMNEMMLPGPTFLLEQKDALELSDEQVQRLESLKSELSELHQAHMSRAMAHRERAMEALRADQPDLAAYEAALEALADEHVTMQVEAARASQNAMTVLAEAQRSNVRFGMHLMHGMHQRMMRQNRMMQRMGG